MRVIAGIGRMALVLVLLGVFVIVGAQFTRMIARNLAANQEVGAYERDVAALQEKKIDQERTIERLSDPRGAVPEIHDRLHLVGPNEAIIYLKGGGSAER